jgi:hypothetical protein
MSTIDQIEDRICNAIRGINTKSLQGDGQWTKAIFKALAELGVSLKLQNLLKQQRNRTRLRMAV